jgi:TRAP transporter TAXI family solute receptor
MRHVVVPLIGLIAVAVAVGFAWAWYDSHRARHVLVLASGPKDSEHYSFAKAFAGVVEARDPRLKIRVIETFGPGENAVLLADNTAQIALVSGDTPILPPMRVVGFLFSELFHLIARSDKAIGGVADVRGKVVGLLPEGSNSRALFWPLIEHYGISRYDVAAMTVLPREAEAALRDGQIDVYFRVAALGNEYIKTLLSTLPLDLVAIDQGAALQLTLPALEPHVIPKGTYDGARPTPAADLPVVGVRGLLVTTDRLKDDVAYSLTRTLYEARRDLVALDQRSSMIEPLNQGVALHPGSEAYFRKDDPLFIVEYAETMGFVLSASVLLFSGLWHMKLRNDRRNKNRADVYNARLVALADSAQRTDSLDELDSLRRELFMIFRQVFADLDGDRVPPDAIPGFTLALTVAAQLIHDRRSLLAPDTTSSRPLG